MGILIGPALGAFLNPLVAASVAAGTGAVCILFVLLLLPESLSQEAATAVRLFPHRLQARTLVKIRLLLQGLEGLIGQQCRLTPSGRLHFVMVCAEPNPTSVSGPRH